MNSPKQANHQMLWTGVTLFPTFVCNLSCPFCAFSADLNQHRDELTLAEIETIARGLGRVLVLHIGGGEPFIRADLPEVIAAFRRHTGVKKVEIPTNGWSAERIGKQVRRILELSPGLKLNVRISLDGIGALHDRVRARPGSYKAAVETLGALQDIARGEKGLSCGVCQTITAHNQEAALSTYRTIRDDLKPDALVVNVCRDGSQDDRASLDVVPERYAEVIGEMNDDVATGVWWNYPKKRCLPVRLLERPPRNRLGPHRRGAQVGAAGGPVRGRVDAISRRVLDRGGGLLRARLSRRKPPGPRPVGQTPARDAGRPRGPGRRSGVATSVTRSAGTPPLRTRA